MTNCQEVDVEEMQKGGWGDFIEKIKYYCLNAPRVSLVGKYCDLRLIDMHVHKNNWLKRKDKLYHKSWCTTKSGNTSRRD